MIKSQTPRALYLNYYFLVFPTKTSTVQITLSLTIELSKYLIKSQILKQPCSNGNKIVVFSISAYPDNNDQYPIKACNANKKKKEKKKERK